MDIFGGGVHIGSNLLNQCGLQKITQLWSSWYNNIMMMIYVGCVNHYELDRSFDTTFPLMRLHPLQPRAAFHKYQHLYIWLIYGLANFGDLFGTFDEMYWMSNYPTRRGHITKKQLAMQVVVKLTWITFCMIIPSYLHGWFNVFPIWFAHFISHS